MMFPHFRKEFANETHQMPIRTQRNSLVVLSALPAFAADVTGSWTSQVKTNDGNELLLTFVFKQEGTKLTGTVATPRETANMSDGKVDGEKKLFTAAFTNSTFTYEGTINGNEIKVAAKVPDFPSSDLTLKRSRQR
jgi:hypothetical protein